MQELLSVIIPVYNQEKNIRRCLDSVISQTYSSIEVIIVDDGSTDGTLKVCKDYTGKNGWSLLHTEENNGVSYARNIGLDHAVGNYVLFIDSDDYISDNYIFELYSTVKKYNCSIAYSQCANVRDSGIELVQEPSITKNVFNVSSEFDYGKSYLLRHAACSIISRELIGCTRFNTNIYDGEDAYFISQLITKSDYMVGYCTNSLYYYVIQQSSGSHGKVDSQKMTVIDAWSLIIENYKKNIPSLVSGCYVSMISEIADLLIRMINSGKYDNRNYTIGESLLRNNIFKIIVPHIYWKRKLLYICLAVSPKFYLWFWAGRK